MNEVLLATALLVTAAMATAVVLTRDVRNQSIVLSAYGLALTVLFVALQAPDVALSQLAVGTVLLPLMVVLAVAKIRRVVSRQRRDSDDRTDPRP